MRIIAKNHDYYDSVMIHGTDPTIIFNRKLVEYNDSNKFSPEIEKYFRETFSLLRGGQLSPDLFAVIFCGKIYRGIRIYTKKEQEENWWYAGYDKTHCYDPEETLKVLKNNKVDLNEELSNKIYIDGKFIKASAERRIKMFFEDHSSDKFMNLMIEKRCPILLIEKTTTYNASLKAIENPILKELDFFRLFDPYTTHQRLSMFIGGLLPREANPTVEISDKDMIVKKGFNKWSFRKMKGD